MQNNKKPIGTRMFLTGIFLLSVFLFSGCGGPTPEELEAVDYEPVSGHGWETSTPAEEGIDPLMIAELYYDAAKLESIHSLLVIKNGKLIAEDYFNSGSIIKKENIQSATKSFTSALVGLAIEEGCIQSVDQKMMDFFPELVDDVQDQRKNDITIKEMLQMRAGYAWEESTDELFELLYRGFRPASLLEIPLKRDPGTGFEYSNLTSHLLGIIVSRGCETDLADFANEHLLGPLDISLGSWTVDWEGYRLGAAEMELSGRDLAKFGLLYLNDGELNGEQIVPAEWVEDSLAVYSENAWKIRVGSNFNTGYGYQWWHIDTGEHEYSLAWGHGGQQIALIPEFNMVIVVTADPLYGQHGDTPWKLEKANLNLVADFVASLPQD